MNAFAELLRQRATATPVGTWIMSASPLVAEAVGLAGFDWAVIDMEHSPLDLATLVHLLQAVGTVSPVFVAVTPAIVNGVITTSATATAAVIPVNGTPANGIPLVTGQLYPFTVSPGSWFTTIDSGAGSTLYITPCG